LLLAELLLLLPWLELPPRQLPKPLPRPHLLLAVLLPPELNLPQDLLKWLLLKLPLPPLLLDVLHPTLLLPCKYTFYKKSIKT
jgi:hypothetical protein